MAWIFTGQYAVAIKNHLYLFCPVPSFASYRFLRSILFSIFLWSIVLCVLRHSFISSSLLLLFFSYLAMNQKLLWHKHKQMNFCCMLRWCINMLGCKKNVLNFVSLTCKKPNIYRGCSFFSSKINRSQLTA